MTTTTTKRKKKTSRTKINLLVDIGIFLVFLLATAPHFTGIAIHEWLSIAFGGTILVHLLLHWEWLVAITRRFFTKMHWKTRVNYILNTALFISVTFIILSGLMISETALPFLGIQLQSSPVWQGLHSLVADLSVFIVGLHIALHLDWIANAIKRYLIQPLRRPRPSQPAPMVQATAVRQEATQ